MTKTVPYYADLAGYAETGGPDDGQTFWLRTNDDVRIRVGQWNTHGTRGTVLFFPGRSEYVEKYGRMAGRLAKRGFASIAIDWRGQGLADRLQPIPTLGHVDSFADYQRDVDAVLAHVRAQGLPEPYYLIGHSMGGCIGLRALHRGLPVEACAFTAPMWGILMAPALRPVAWTLSSVSRPLRFSHVFAPGQQPTPVVTRVSYEENTLTTDRAMFDELRRHLALHPELGLGGASLNWLNESLIEMRALAALPSPPIPCVTFLGTDEAIVDPARIHDRMARWPRGQLVMFEGAKHEVLIERAPVRDRIVEELDRHFVPDPGEAVAV